MDSLAPLQQQQERKAALHELIDHELLRVATKDEAATLPVSDDDLDEAVKRLATRFESPDEMRANLAAEGIDSDKELRLRLGARLQPSPPPAGRPGLAGASPSHSPLPRERRSRD